MKASVLIGKKTSSNIQIDILKYEQQPSDDYHDSNWLSCDVSVSCESWVGRKFSTSFQTTDFRDFLDSLLKLNELLSGDAAFSSMEEQLEFRLIGDGRGNIEVVGKATSSRIPCCELTFGFDIDQTYLAAIISQLRSVTSHFPIR